jgi:hypothetical protein
MSGKSFGAKMGDWFRHNCFCCDLSDEDEAPPKVIVSFHITVCGSSSSTDTSQGEPYNFRREDPTIPGLDPKQ